jgi:hypothetical protein
MKNEEIRKEWEKFMNDYKELFKSNEEILNEISNEIIDNTYDIEETTSTKSNKSQTIQQLKEQCKSLGIKGYSRKKKEELIELINNHK